MREPYCRHCPLKDFGELSKETCKCLPVQEDKRDCFGYHAELVSNGENINHACFYCKDSDDCYNETFDLGLNELQGDTKL